MSAEEQLKLAYMTISELNQALNNAFIYVVIESCQHNEIDSGKYVSYLLGKLKTSHDGKDLTGLLPCC